MVFFKRLSRSRSNSQSYVDGYDSRHDSKTNSATYDDKFAGAAVAPSPTEGVPVSRQSSNDAAHNSLAKETGSTSMYARQSQPTEVSHGQYNQNQYASPPTSAGGARGAPNGYSSSYDDAGTARKSDTAPDLLLQAFNQALRPHLDKVDTLESEIADLNKYIAQLESQQREVHAWIDKRGLRPGKHLRSMHPADTI